MNSSKKLKNSVFKAYKNKNRLVAPLVGFPGVKLVNSSIKLAQQNIREHFKVVKANYNQFQPDVIFPLMDLSVEVNALGREFLFPENDSATIIKKVFFEEELKKIENINIEHDSRLLSYVETVGLMTRQLPNETLKAAYVTGPYTIAGLLMGADEAALSTITNAEMLHNVCKLAESILIKYVNLLTEAGAQVICFLEPSAVMLSPNHFEIFSANYVKKIIKLSKFYGDFVYHICGNTNHLIDNMIKSGVDALSLDSNVVGINLCNIAKYIPEDIILVGNINPTGKILNGNSYEIENEIYSLLKNMDEIPNFVLSTGCDLPLETPIKNIETFMDVGKNYKVRNSIVN